MRIDWNAVTGVATLLAVLVALFQEPLRRWRNAPKLLISVRRRDSTEHEFGADDDENANIYVRVLVTNGGREVAENVQVTVADLYTKHGEKYELEPKFLQTALLWTHSETPILPLLPNEIGRLCNVGLFSESIPKKGEPKFWFKFATEVDSKLGYEYLDCGHFLLRLALTGSNCESTTHYLEISIGPHTFAHEPLVFSLFYSSAPFWTKLWNRRLRTVDPDSAAIIKRPLKQRTEPPG